MLALIHGNISSQVSQQIMSQLSTDRDRSYIKKFKRAHRQEQSLLGRSLLRGLLSLHTKTHAYEWGINIYENSGLILSHPDYHNPIYGSISHSHDTVVAAISSHGPVGVDIEKIDPKRNMGKLLNSLKQTPCEYIPSSRNTQYTLWTVFESYYKASSPLVDYAIPSEMIQLFKETENIDVLKMEIGNKKYFFKSTRLNDFALTISCRY